MSWLIVAGALLLIAAVVAAGLRWLMRKPGLGAHAAPRGGQPAEARADRSAT